MRKPVIIAAFALALLACKNQNHEPSSTPRDDGYAGGAAEPGDSADQGQPVKEVVKDPQYGEQVTLEGKVDTVYNDQAFTMKAGIFQDDLLVVAPKDLVIEALSAPSKVRVSGTVKQMVVSEVEREYAFDFDNAVEVKWESKPYLVATSLERLPD